MLDTILASFPTAVDIFNFFVEHASYLFVFIFMVIESSFIPFPSEVVVPPAVYLACTDLGAGSEMEPWLVVVFATAGAFVGAFVNYCLALWVGRPIIYRFADSKIGHACLIDRKKVEKAEKYFDKHGAVSTFIGRLIPAIRQLISIPAGISRMNIGIFSLFTSLGALVWNVILALLGWWLSTTVSPDELLPAIEKYNGYLSWAGLVLALICVFIIIRNVTKNRNKVTKP